MPNKAVTYVKEYVTAYGKDGGGGRALGDKIMVGSLLDYMMQSYSSFTDQAGHNYGVGALIVTYFCDLKRDEEFQNLQNFLRALKDGKKGEEAIDVLLNGRSIEELEKSINRAWRSKGVTLTFR